MCSNFHSDGTFPCAGGSSSGKATQKKTASGNEPERAAMTSIELKIMKYKTYAVSTQMLERWCSLTFVQPPGLLGNDSKAMS